MTQNQITSFINNLMDEQQQELNKIETDSQLTETQLLAKQWSEEHPKTSKSVWFYTVFQG